MFKGRVFIPPAEVHSKLGQIKLVDARFKLGNPAYGLGVFHQSRLPGALFADLDSDLSGVNATTPCRHPMPADDRFVSWCLSKDLGVAVPAEPIVCYDEMSGGMGAARAWWMLDQLGLEAYILDGGFPRWSHEKLPLEVETPTAQQSLTNVNDLSVQLTHWKHNRTLKQKMLSEIEEEEEKRDGVASVNFLIDSRPAARFDSKIRPEAMDTLPGHMPGAVSSPWMKTLKAVTVAASAEGGEPREFHQLADVEQLKANFEEVFTKRAASQKGHTVFYCGSGVSACQNLAALRHVTGDHLSNAAESMSPADAGVYEAEKPKLYGGSWSEYAGLRAEEISKRVILEHGALIRAIQSNPAGTLVGASPATTVSVDGKIVVLKDLEPMVLRDALLEQMRFGEKLEVRTSEQTFECVSADEPN